MTTLISWVGVDSRQPSSIYLASDSRYSWPSGAEYDVGQKLYFSKSMPEMFGFCGDVTFLANTLTQLCDQIDMGALISLPDSFDSKLNKMASFIGSRFQKFPKIHFQSSQVIYVTRIGVGMKSKFFAGLIELTPNGDCLAKALSLPPTSDLIKGVGSGVSSVDKWRQQWQKSDSGRTSRCIFGAFCDSILSQEDPLSGGAPQLLGLYREGKPRVFGVIWNDQRFISGHVATDEVDLDAYEWRNRHFERCDPNTLTLLNGAQPQPRPSNAP